MVMMYLAIATWLLFVIASAVSIQVIKNHEAKKLNRRFVNVIDDTFKAIQMTLGIIEKNQAAHTKLVIDLTDAILALDKGYSVPIKPSVPMIPVVKPSVGKFVMDLEYTRDKFAETSMEKNVIDKLINRIRDSYGHSTRAS